jgi:hypothetical protein
MPKGNTVFETTGTIFSIVVRSTIPTGVSVSNMTDQCGSSRSWASDTPTCAMSAKMVSSA